MVAVATRPAPGAETVTTADEHDLTLAGYLVFLDQPKLDAAEQVENGLAPAEFAIEMLRFPLRQVFGDTAVASGADSFVCTYSVAQLADRFDLAKEVLGP